MSNPNDCPSPRLCARYGWHCHGRYWEVFNNLNVDREAAAALRKAWDAGEQPCPEDQLPPRLSPQTQPLPLPPKPKWSGLSLEQQQKMAEEMKRVRAGLGELPKRGRRCCGG
jgi:hypothetical protein